ncbi:hypothetical protein [Streptomyces sp. NPDC060322]|uniref:hypothetical protein n=1 Tax=Streptomyces sp. NPDC060322 TaxID=3347097 RepID=UPI00366A482D
MARVRYIGAEPVTVPELGSRTVQPDELVDVPDGRFDAYVCQPANWESVDEPKPTETAKKPTAAKAATLKEG